MRYLKTVRVIEVAGSVPNEQRWQGSHPLKM